jgi:hypothetical protein
LPATVVNIYKRELSVQKNTLKCEIFYAENSSVDQQKPILNEVIKSTVYV